MALGPMGLVPLHIQAYYTQVNAGIHKHNYAGGIHSVKCVYFCIQWTLINPDRVNPEPRKSEVPNQLIN